MSNAEQTQRMNAVQRQISEQMGPWLDYLATHGIDRSYPVSPINEATRVSSGFGRRNVRGHGDGMPPPTRKHEAIDMVPASGRTEDVDVVAVVSGRVLYVGTPDAASGFSIVIGGDNGKIYSYAHLENGSADVRVGQRVGRMQPIATMGDTGTVTSACVHVVERQIPFDYAEGKAGDFDKWSWRNRSGTLGDRIAPAAVREALTDFRRDHDGRTVNFLDFERVPPRLRWEEDPKKHTIIPANTERDRDPHAHEMRRRAQAARPAVPPAAKAELEPSWGSQALDTLNSALCTVSFGWVGSCETPAAQAPARPTPPRQR